MALSAFFVQLFVARASRLRRRTVFARFDRSAGFGLISFDTNYQRLLTSMNRHPFLQKASPDLRVSFFTRPIEDQLQSTSIPALRPEPGSAIFVRTITQHQASTPLAFNA